MFDRIIFYSAKTLIMSSNLKSCLLVDFVGFINQLCSCAVKMGHFILNAPSQKGETGPLSSVLLHVMNALVVKYTLHTIISYLKGDHAPYIQQYLFTIIE